MTTFRVSITEAGSATTSQDASIQAGFALQGGRYGITASSASWGTGQVKLKKLAGDQATYLDTLASAFSADGYQTINLPGGTYKVVSTV